MKRTSWLALAAGLILLAAAGLLVVNARPQPTRETLIRQALREAEEAAKKRSVGGVMGIVSNDYKDASNLNKDRLRIALARSYQMARGMSYDVRVKSPTVVPDQTNPDEALVFTTISVVDATGGGQELWGGAGQTITFKMRRETGRKWLVFPEDRWRVVSVVNLPPLPGLGSEDGGGGGLLGGL